ncbi:hypothetical protein B7486_02070 [cyanobacterium TDX16]|nr:hypothetical protein B7486_02070 [cyanobacterium TDX16]
MERVHAAYEGVYQYNFGAPNDTFWHYSDRTAWKFSSPPAPAKFTPMELASKLHAARLHFFQTLTPRSKPITGDAFLWLASDTASDAVEGPLSVMLNNVCRSESIQRFCYVATFAHTHVTVELIGLRSGEPRWYYHDYQHRSIILAALISSFPQIVLDTDATGVVVVDKDNNFCLRPDAELRDTANRLKGCRVLHECSVLGYSVSDDRMQLRVKIRDDMTLAEYPRGRISWALPIPGKPTDKTRLDRPAVDFVNSPEVTVKSRHVSEALKHLSRIWQDRFVASVLITAPPGSGKEAYADSVAFGTGRGSKPLHTICLAAGAREELEKQLFGSLRPDSSHVEGLLAKASGGTIFLDEVHHPETEAGIRASLLRVLENNSYYPVGCSEELKVKDVLYVLATSRRLRKSNDGSSGKPLARVPPPDFWTRMSHVVEVVHPLALRGKELIDATKCFFVHFWCERVKRVMDVDLFVPSRETDSAAVRLRQELAADLVAEPKLKDASKTFVERLAAALPGRRLSLVSIRGIRSMVSSLVSEAALSVISGKEWYNDTLFRASCETIIQDILRVALLKNPEPRGRRRLQGRAGKASGHKRKRRT